MHSFNEYNEIDFYTLHTTAIWLHVIDKIITTVVKSYTYICSYIHVTLKYSNN